MPRIIVRISSTLLEESRQYAAGRDMSLNDLVRRLLEQAVRDSSRGWLEAYFELADRAGGDSRRKRWRRGDLYDA